MNAPLPSFQPDPGNEHAGRRIASRLRTRLPAVIMLHSGLFHVTLDNLALHGARITLRMDQTAECQPGSNAVLQWHTYETFCTVRWQAAQSMDERAHLPADKEQLRMAARAWVAGQRI